ncbi:hypothetical protein H8356DRAFT_1303488 [Neocallimastix lanati (nom. inval.)]|uniref:Uncharacterized protein n=1 Tax=Neocallimastix californiae TaxID=1754190 RepID=A0A1Y1ZFB9_9FUNG|nr:hypothetical protein H8356DRAFT_1303488 [Neocallimastix sp. JGI-2020a]ORY08884.1 hypothetical protein LY90DRAFT_518952 [Neocallimastix californiae]|eukprot:ORY08884.1 hypothetical protein LY90DRAFT_518952 [Neocallimastix californiae]
MACFCFGKKGKFFPRINKCILCCGLDFETSIKVCTIIMTVLSIISAYGSMKAINSYFSVLIYIIVSISLIFLTIGLYKNKVSYMNQFIYVFLVYLIILTIAVVGIIGIYIYFVLNYGKIYDYIERAYNFLAESADTEQSSLIVTVGIYIAVFVIYYILQIYYYIVTGSYIQRVKEELKDGEYNRKIEENNL